MFADMGLLFGAAIATSAILPCATVTVACTTPNGSEIGGPVNVPDTAGADFAVVVADVFLLVLDEARVLPELRPDGGTTLAGLAGLFPGFRTPLTDLTP
jgi:hypothetical protein